MIVIKVTELSINLTDAVTPITTWNGEKSQSEIEAEKERQKNNRKSWAQKYDEDIDRGRVSES